MLHLSNEEIREKLIECNYKCGPVTDTTREIYLKKLEALSKARAVTIDLQNGGEDKLTDCELRAQLLSLGESVAPITNTNRHIYVKRLKKLKMVQTSSKKSGEEKKDNEQENVHEGCEPMDVD